MPKPLRRVRRRLRASSRNVLELARLGRLGDPYGAPYEVVDRGEHHRLRRYATLDQKDAPAALLVPPLMVTSEIYDMAEDTSAVSALGALGVQTYVIDFGAPERESGGMTRTLDDHVRAVVRCIELARQMAGRDVHVCGYSQGGMFAYQAAAHLRGEGVRSLVTFGSPVDIHRGLPALPSEITAALVRAAEPGVRWILDRVEGLPGALTSAAFKMLSPRKEIQARLEFVQKLHDRNALVRREARRRFLGGEGFVAWPGPALRVFVEEFIVHNRMLHGGFVIDGRTVSLADITRPILAFVGGSDEIARPESVRAIALAAPDAPVDFVTVPAGHFGLVVGSRAMKTTWPTVAEWIHFHEGGGPRPRALSEPSKIDDDLEPDDFEIEIELLFDTVARTLKDGVRRLGDVVAGATDAADAVRYQEPRLRRLADLREDTRISPALELAARAAEAPEATFFLWHDRAFSFQAADVRVTNVARGLYACGVRAGDRVGVAMGSRPSFLSMVCALSRLGAVAVIVPPDAHEDEARRAFAAAGVKRCAADPESAARWQAALEMPVLVLGGGGGARALAPGLVDMEAIDPAGVEMPEGLALDAGRARDLAMILLRPAESGELRAAPITNHRWALSALGAGAACTLKPRDTVYCGVPLHHPTGILVTVGAALASGSRLALAERFTPSTFLVDARRAGATVVFYAGEMLRALLFERPGRGDRATSIRLFAGSGMRTDLAARLRERFGAGVMEFYAGTTQRVILANATGEKPGALGRMLPGSAEVAVARLDAATRAPLRGADGFFVRAERGEAGLLVARVADGDEDAAGPGVVAGAFEAGDRWFVSHDVVREDEGGDYWFVDSLSGFVTTKSGLVSTRRVEDALYALAEVQLAAVVSLGGGALGAAFVAKAPVAKERIDEALGVLAEHERPSVVKQVASIALTDGCRPKKGDVARALAAGASAASTLSAPRPP